jgi:hypothetical protein
VEIVEEGLGERKKISLEQPLNEENKLSGSTISDL